MGFFEKNMGKMRTDMAAAKVQYRDSMAELNPPYICPECSGTMKEPMLRPLGFFRVRIVKCAECGLEMLRETAKNELKLAKEK